MLTGSINIEVNTSPFFTCIDIKMCLYGYDLTNWCIAKYFMLCKLFVIPSTHENVHVLEYQHNLFYAHVRVHCHAQVVRPDQAWHHQWSPWTM